jgi:hypothetical protein
VDKILSVDAVAVADADDAAAGDAGIDAEEGVVAVSAAGVGV